MQETLINKLYAYIRENNPDLLFHLREEAAITGYLQSKADAIIPLVQQLEQEQKPAYIIEALCMEEMTRELKPSRFNYLSQVLEEEFEAHYTIMKENGTLTYEIINMLNDCKAVFDQFDFSEANEDGRFLRYAIIGTMHGYLNKGK